MDHALSFAESMLIPPEVDRAHRVRRDRQEQAVDTSPGKRSPLPFPLCSHVKGS
jgi:hypothetical protein